jgi:hypothetical protein
MQLALLSISLNFSLWHPGPAFGWRWPFVIVAVPAVVSSAMMILTTTEPAKGMMEESLQDTYSQCEDFTYDEKLDWAKIKLLFRCRQGPTAMCD